MLSPLWLVLDEEKDGMMGTWKAIQDTVEARPDRGFGIP